MITHRRRLEPLPHAALQALCLHQAHDALTTHRFAVLDQVLPDARAAVDECRAASNRDRNPAEQRTSVLGTIMGHP